MGGFYGSIHIHSELSDRVKNILLDISKREGHKFFISKPVNGWIGVFPDNSGQIPIADSIAEKIDSDIIEMVVYHDDVFRYWYYENGKLVDEYNSCPDYFGEIVTKGDRKRLKGRPEVFTKFIVGKSKISVIRKILKVSSPLGKIEMSERIKDFNKKLTSLSREVEALIKDPEKFEQFLRDNPQLMEEHIERLKQNVRQKGLSSQEEIQSFLEKNCDIFDIGMQLMESFIKQKMNSKKYDIMKPGSKEQKEMSREMDKLISGPNCTGLKEHFNLKESVFASENMRKFADILGIKNAVTSYEYLAQGEIDNIIGWQDFIRIS